MIIYDLVKKYYCIFVTLGRLNEELQRNRNILDHIFIMLELNLNIDITQDKMYAEVFDLKCFMS